MGGTNERTNGEVIARGALMDNDIVVRRRKVGRNKGTNRLREHRTSGEEACLCLLRTARTKYKSMFNTLFCLMWKQKFPFLPALCLLLNSNLLLLSLLLLFKQIRNLGIRGI
jgi:hypothetical protein